MSDMSGSQSHANNPPDDMINSSSSLPPNATNNTTNAGTSAAAATTTGVIISHMSSVAESNSNSVPITASALDAFINSVTRQNSNNFSLKHVAEYIRKTDDLLFNNLQRLDQALSLLNTADNSLAIAQILWAKLASVPLDADPVNSVEPLILQTIGFLKDANYPDIETHGLDIFSRMCKTFAGLLVTRKRTHLGIQPLRNVIKVLRKPGELLTIMTSFLYLCLKSENFKPALEILDVDIVEIRQEGPKLEIPDILLYFYYGGVCYLAMKNYSRANLLFEIAISTPATAISKIMIEAYKKFILTSFILFGKLKSSPVKAAPSANTFLRSVKSSTQGYSDIFDCKSATELKELKEKNEALYKEDENLGLVKQCVVSMYKRNIQKLTKTFLTLSLSDITAVVKLENTSQTEKLLTEMIEDDQICARIDHKQGMVYFLDNSEASTGDQALQKLSSQVAKCVEINTRFQELDDSIKTSVLYQEKLQRSGSAGDVSAWEYHS